MKVLRYSLWFCALSALPATAVFGQTSSSAVQTVTFSVKRTHGVASLGTQQGAAGQSQNAADLGDPIAARRVRVSVGESASSSSVDVLPVAASSLEAASTSAIATPMTVPSTGSDQKSSSYIHPSKSSASTWVVMTITD